MKKLLTLAIVVSLLILPTTSYVNAVEEKDAELIFSPSAPQINSNTDQLSVTANIANVSSYEVEKINTITIKVMNTSKSNIFVEKTFTDIELKKVLVPGGYTTQHFEFGEVKLPMLKGSFDEDGYPLVYEFEYTGVVGKKHTLPKGVKVYYKEQLINFDIQPEIINGRTMVPVRAISEALGYKVDWAGGETSNGGIATLTRDGKWMQFVVGEKFIQDSDGNKFDVDTPSIIKNGRVLVSVRSLSKAVFCNPIWGSKEQMVIISSSFYLN